MSGAGAPTPLLERTRTAWLIGLGVALVVVGPALGPGLLLNLDLVATADPPVPSGVWGLGPELHDGKAPHWMPTTGSAATFGHFGGSGTFLWVDPEARVACVGLTDRVFGAWAMDVWPPFSDAVLAQRPRR